MKQKYTILILLIAMGIQTVRGQEFEIVLTSPESGAKTHYARNSITLGLNYSYTPNGGTLTAEIQNPIISGDINYNYTVVDPLTRSLNTSYLVGATQGAFDVSPLGGATYTIPIDVLPGVAGLQPSLAITYNSMGGPGVAGYGWNISGISAITRTGKTYYHDGAAGGVSLAGSDRFSLDGQRLVCTSGTYGANSSQYRIDNDIFTRISCTGVSYGPTQFLGETKSGLTYQYGYDSDADQTIEGSNYVVSWYVNKVTDNFGNQMNYEYIKDNGSIYPAEITYGPNTITFYYKYRSDKTTAYLNGSKIEQNLLLDRIEIKYNSTVIKKYEFKYNYRTSNYGNCSVLNEVIEYGTNNSRYNSTAFSYEYPSNGVSNYPYLEYNNYISTNYIQYKGDFNGDGRDDIFTVNKSNRKDWRLYHGTDYGGFTYKTAGSTTFEIDQVIPVDLNGDGRQDLMLRCFVDRGYYYPYGVSDLYAFYYVISDENSIQTPQFFTREYYPLSTLAGVKIENSILESSSTDFDGDGLEDMFVRTNNSWKIFGFTYNGSSLTFSEKITGGGSLPGDKLKFGDFNGDGKMDLYTIDANGIKIYRINIDGSLTILYSGSIPKKDHHFETGDFNGDGKTDIFVYGYTTYDWSDWQLYLSTGSGFQVNYIP